MPKKPDEGEQVSKAQLARDRIVTRPEATNAAVIEAALRKRLAASVRDDFDGDLEAAKRALDELAEIAL